MTASVVGTCAGCRQPGPASCVHPVAEMMYGTREVFHYLDCSSCGSLSLLDPPPSLAPYYPADYHGSTPGGRGGERSRWELGKELASRVLGSGWARAALGRCGGQRRWLSLLGLARVGPRSRILDVGCGTGHRLAALGRLGLRCLAGVDPYAPAPARGAGAGRFPILHGEIDDVEGTWDVVMFHHSLEHVPDPTRALARAARLVPDGGHVLVRVPVAGGFAWRRYRSHWVQIDAPRHTVVPSLPAMSMMADAAGLSVVSVLFDSGAFQFWGSEQYERGVPLLDPASHAVDPSSSAFGRGELRRYEVMARRLNRIGDGDQAAFLLRRGSTRGA